MWERAAQRPPLLSAALASNRTLRTVWLYGSANLNFPREPGPVSRGKRGPSPPFRPSAALPLNALECRLHAAFMHCVINSSVADLICDGQPPSDMT